MAQVSNKFWQVLKVGFGLKAADGVSSLQWFQVLRFAAQSLVAVLLARGGLSLEQIADYESLWLMAGLCGFFWIGAWMNALVPLYHQNKTPKDRASLIKGSFLLMSVVSVAIVLILLAAESGISHLFGQNKIEGYKLFCLFLLFHFPSFLSEYILLLEGRSKLLIQYAWASLIGMTGLLIYPSLIAPNYDLVIQALLLFGILKFIFLIYLLFPHRNAQWSKDLWEKHSQLAWPLSLSLLLGGLSTYIDGLVVGSQKSSEEFTIFRYGARELPFVLLLANAFSSATAGKVSDDLQSALPFIKERSESLLKRMLPWSILLLFVSSILFEFIFGEQFGPAHIVFDIYLLLIIPRLLFPQTILTGLELAKPQMLISALELVLNLILSLWWIGPFGVEGVAAATLVAHWVDKVLLIVYLQKSRKIIASQYIALRSYLLGSIVLAAAYALSRLLIA